MKAIKLGDRNPAKSRKWFQRRRRAHDPMLVLNTCRCLTRKRVGNASSIRFRSARMFGYETNCVFSRPLRSAVFQVCSASMPTAHDEARKKVFHIPL